MSQEIYQQRKTKIEELKTLSVEPHGRAYARTAMQDIKENDKAVSCAGRIMAFRRHGKTSFLDLADWTGKIQLYFKTDALAEPDRRIFDLLDIGDIIGVKGDVFRTRTGELTILVGEFRLLSKSLSPLPEKWHGLKDVETRFRQRYVDLIMNHDAREIFRKRALAVQTMREFLHQRGYCEVETPMMQPIPGGAEARPFITHHNTLDMQLYLRVAPELYLKRLLVGGFEKVFEINRSFRNEGISPQHNPEFTMLELYAAYEDYRTMMAVTEEIIAAVAEKLNGSLQCTYQEKTIDLTRPWKTMTWAEALAAAGIPDWRDLAAVRRKLEEWDIPVEEDEKNSLYDLIEHVFKRKIQPSLVNPTFIIEYPRDISPLAKNCPGRADMTERFELYVAGMELANAYSELNDPVEQKLRFEEEVKTQRPDRPKTVDTDYIEALEYGMPPAGGLGIGIDRLVMVLTGAPSIREVILFPLLRAKSE